MPEPNKKVPVNPENIPDKPNREMSQTDHLNKKLLTSLFKRMDEGGDSTLSNMMEDDNKTEDHEWED